MAQSSIEWTQTVWNPTTGCTKVSQGCKNCYALVMHRRLAAMGQAKYSEPFSTIVCHESELERPATWKSPQLVFVNSMSDLFHEAVPVDFIHRVFKVMNDTPRHTYQVLTKRPRRMRQLSNELSWTPNIWAGTSVESNSVIERIFELEQTGAKVKFLSCEPLISNLMLTYTSLRNIDWVIVGGESGPKARPMPKRWVDEIFDMCQITDTPFFFKQWGGKNKKAAGREYRGQEWNEMPHNYRFGSLQPEKRI